MVRHNRPVLELTLVQVLQARPTRCQAFVLVRKRKVRNILDDLPSSDSLPNPDMSDSALLSLSSLSSISSPSSGSSEHSSSSSFGVHSEWSSISSGNFNDLENKFVEWWEAQIQGLVSYLLSAQVLQVCPLVKKSGQIDLVLTNFQCDHPD